MPVNIILIASLLSLRLSDDGRFLFRSRDDDARIESIAGCSSFSSAFVTCDDLVPVADEDRSGVLVDGKNKA